MKLTIGFLLTILFLAVVCQQVDAGASHSTSRSKQDHNSHRDNGHAGGSHSPSRSRQGHKQHRDNGHAGGSHSPSRSRQGHKSHTENSNSFDRRYSDSGHNKVNRPNMSDRERQELENAYFNHIEKNVYDDHKNQKRHS